MMEKPKIVIVGVDGSGQQAAAAFKELGHTVEIVEKVEQRSPFDPEPILLKNYQLEPLYIPTILNGQKKFRKGNNKQRKSKRK